MCAWACRIENECIERALPVLSIWASWPTIPFCGMGIKIILLFSFSFILFIYFHLAFFLRRLAFMHDTHTHTNTSRAHKWSCSFHISRDELISRIPTYVVRLYVSEYSVCSVCVCVSGSSDWTRWNKNHFKWEFFDFVVASWMCRRFVRSPIFC